jgi:hypothetical protein
MVRFVAALNQARLNQTRCNVMSGPARLHGISAYREIERDFAVGGRYDSSKEGWSRCFWRSPLVIY